LRLSLYALLTLFGGLLLAACAGGGGSQVKASCDAIEGIKSYRYLISLKLQSPAFQGSPNENPDDPLSGFAEALTQLFSDIQLEGEFVAPDRSKTIMRFQDEELELRAIGDKSWVRIGDTWQEQAEPPQEGNILTPETVCRDLVENLAPSLQGAEAQEDTVNGIEARRYHLDEADLEGLPELLGTEAETELPTDFEVDVWLAKDGDWPVRLQVRAADTEGDGQPVSLELSMEFKDINDRNIEIEPPPVSPIGT